jgi:hypothetical protein
VQYLANPTSEESKVQRTAFTFVSLLLDFELLVKSFSPIRIFLTTSVSSFDENLTLTQAL